MKVRIVLTVDVDPDAWEAEFGTEREVLRDDVRSYVWNQITGSAAQDSGVIRHVGMER